MDDAPIKTEQDGFRRSRRAPTPAQEGGRPREEGAFSPAAVWNNPAAAPDGRGEARPGERMARERQGRTRDNVLGGKD